MKAEEALRLQNRDKVTVSWNAGRSFKEGRVVRVENHEPTVVVRVWFGGPLQTVKSFPHHLIVSNYCGRHGWETDTVDFTRTKEYIAATFDCGCKDVSPR